MRNRSVAAVFFYAIVANVPFWIASHYFGLVVKGWFNLEFVVIGILSVFIRRWITIALLAGAILVDLLSGIGSTYWLSGSEMICSADSVLAITASRISDVVLVLTSILCVCFAIKAVAGMDMTGRERTGIAVSLAIFLCMCAAFDVATGHTSFRLDRQLGTIRLTRIPTHALYQSELDRWSREARIASSTDGSVPAAAMKMIRFDSSMYTLSSAKPNLVLILVESWGMPLASNLKESLFLPYMSKDLVMRYTLSRGAIPFRGATVAGEARELCESTMGLGVLSASESRLRTCLPTRLNEMGYHTLGIHGFSAKMFERGEWYRRIGFGETMFLDQLQSEGLPVCPGPFPGICDAAISSWIGNQLQKSTGSPQFIYWVTLNSHLPVPIPNQVKDAPSCAEIPAVAESEALCSWYQLEFNVHRSVAALARREAERPTVFIIVGDHAPPFASSALREQFSDQVVPFVMLVPKKNTPKDQQAMRTLISAARPAKGAHPSHLKGGNSPSSSITSIN